MSGLPTIAAIQGAVAGHYGIPVEKMREPEPHNKEGLNRWEFCRPRQVAMCLASRLTDKGAIRLARIFNRDHSTVYSGIAAAERRCFNDNATKIAMRTITKRILSRVA